MKKGLIVIVSIVHLWFFFCPEIVSAQNVVQRIELKVAPFQIAYARFDPFEDLDSADLTIIIKESALPNFSNDKFFKILKSDEKKKKKNIIGYRIKCTIYLFSGKSEVLYMNVFGEFLYKKNTYKSERIKEFIFEHIPNAYKY